MSKLFAPRETAPGETRVSATPETVKRLAKKGVEVTIESDAGRAAHLLDAAYVEAGAKVVKGDAAVAAWGEADIVTTVVPPTLDQAKRIKEKGILIGLLAPYKSGELVKLLREKKVTSLAMELVPRISRAQSIDALSSQASIAGYKAVLLAAAALDKYLPLLMTAAGTIHPAKVVIMGAGVAGLQAIATAKRLGAVVEVSDIREAVKEQVESLGGRFIELPMKEKGEGEGGYAREVSKEFLQKQQEIVHKHVAAADVVITTALVPGKPAPKLITEKMVEDMREGSVIVDLAVEQGGNCALSKKGEEVVAHGVRIIGHANLPATLPLDASMLYARNLAALIELLITKEKELKINVDDEVVAGSLLTHDGGIVHAPTAEALGEKPAPKPEKKAEPEKKDEKKAAAPAR